MGTHYDICYNEFVLISNKIDYRQPTNTKRRAAVNKHNKKGNTTNEKKYDDSIGHYSVSVKRHTPEQEARLVIMKPIVDEGVRDGLSIKEINIKLAYEYGYQRKNMDELLGVTEDAIKSNISKMLKNKEAKNIKQLRKGEVGYQCRLFD